MSGHVAINRTYWDAMADDWVAAGERLWASEPNWGIWGNAETDIGLLPDDMRGLDAVELGCGTGYVSGWMARRGARVTGIDISAGQLATARRLAEKHRTEIRFIEGNAEKIDLPAASFDFAISEYGAAIWCDPDVWLREAFRLLKPAGRLVFLGNHPLMIACCPESGAPCDFALHRTYRGMKAVDWTQVEIDPGGVEFNRTFSGWLDLFRDIGFSVTGYHELYAPDTADGLQFAVPAEWAKRYPSEQVWQLDKSP